MIAEQKPRPPRRRRPRFRFKDLISKWTELPTATKWLSGVVLPVVAVLGALGLPNSLKPSTGPPPAEGPAHSRARTIVDLNESVALSSYYTEGDRRQHVVALKRDVVSTRWFPAYERGGDAWDLGEVPNALAISALETPDKVSRVYVATYEKIVQISQRERGPVEIRDLVMERGILKLAAYFSPADQRVHLVIASNSEVNELVFETEGSLVSRRQIATIEGLDGLGAFYSRVNQKQYAVVATLSSEARLSGSGAKEIRVLDLSAGGSSEVTARTLAYNKDIGRLTAFDSPADGYDRVVVATRAGEIEQMLFVRGTYTGTETIRKMPDEVVSLSGYYAPIDRLQHVITSTSDGKVQEVWYPGK